MESAGHAEEGSTGAEDVMDDYMFVASCPCGRRTLATKGSPALCIGCLEKLFAEPVNRTRQGFTKPEADGRSIPVPETEGLEQSTATGQE
jgi:hypothetical protein